ncbi:MAG: cyanophycinase [Opitutaceae bacterium]|jgi:cyanophycinase|nr:cyanophycinase [Opitutaceae bacterium]
MKTRITSIIIAAMLCAAAFAAKPDGGAFKKEVIHARGTLVVIGGGEIPRAIGDKIVSLAGGAGNARVLVVPYATKEKDRGLPMLANSDRDMLVKLGCKSVEMVTAAKVDMDKPETLAMLDGVNIVFFSGGSQLRLFNYLKGSKFLEKIQKIYDDGGVIAGTSAGAAVQCRVMMTGKENNKSGRADIFDRIETGYVETRQGFGYLQNIIIDQHVLIRKRTNRLFSAVMDNPALRGVGIDEATAIVVSPDSSFEVVGKSKVMVVEPMQELKEGEPLTTFKVIILANGDKYKL